MKILGIEIKQLDKLNTVLYVLMEAGKTDWEPQECRTGCPDQESPYYFEDKKFCLTKCDKNKGQYYNRKDENDKTCVNKCEEGNDKIINENYCAAKCELFYFSRRKIRLHIIIVCSPALIQKILR